MYENILQKLEDRKMIVLGTTDYLLHCMEIDRHKTEIDYENNRQNG